LAGGWLLSSRVKFGIAVSQGKPLRKCINEAPLAMFTNGTYEQIYRQ
jgi:hypothetical protein